MDETPMIPTSPPIRYRSFLSLTLHTWTIAIASFYFGYSLVYLAAIKIATINRIYHSDLDEDISSGILNGSIPLGALFGALSCSFLLALLSRRYLMHPISRQCLLAVNGAALTLGILIFIQNYYLLLVVRVLQGCCVGLYSAIIPLIIKELAPTEVRGLLGTYAQLNVTLGIVSGTFLRYLLSAMFDDPHSDRTWWVLFGLPLVVLVLQTVLIIFVYPFETPKYLLLKNRKQEALQLLRRIFKD